MLDGKIIQTFNVDIMFAGIGLINRNKTTTCNELRVADNNSFYFPCNMQMAFGLLLL